MPSIEWKWSEWIPLAEPYALVAHTVGRSATETAQHCMATHRANQASRWHSLDVTQERCTEQKKKKKKATCPWQLYSVACLDSYPMNWYSKAIYTLVPDTSVFLLWGLSRRATFFLFFSSQDTNIKCVNLNYNFGHVLFWQINPNKQRNFRTLLSP